MIVVACCLWDANEQSFPFSKCYSEDWADRLYRGFKRNLTRKFRFIVFTEKPRKFVEPGIEQLPLETSPPHVGCLIEPFKLNVPSIICGLDMAVLGNIDHMADYCLTGEKIAVPRHPTKPDYGTINPVAFIPAGHRKVFDGWRGENDMDWLRKQETIHTDTMWPKQILSYKLHDVRRWGTQHANIIYFHGSRKPHELQDPWLKEHWR